VSKRPKNAAPPPHECDEEANDRLDQARTQKVPFDQDIRESLFFTSTLLPRLATSQSQPPSTPLHDDGYLQTSVGAELSADFVTEVTNTFLPQGEQWCERRPGMFVPEANWKAKEKKVQDDDKTIFETIKASNFYPEFAKAADPYLAIGTMGLFIIDPHPAQAIRAMAVPLHELDLNLGPYGDLDDRFATRFTKNRFVKTLLPGINIPADLIADIEKGPEKKTEVRWGYWRLWDELGDETWMHVAMIKNRVVHSAKLIGEGCCPLIPIRFGATASWAFGLGPTIKNLPELRQVDELEGQKISHIELNLTPPMGFPDDSFAAIEQGLEPGMGYPIRVGSQDAIKKLYDPGTPEAGIYAVDDKIRRLRKQFYVDYPEQRGDTPPTLGQWMDELARAQRRIGTPGLTFWQEGPAQIFLRYKYLLEKRGVIQPIRVDGNVVSLRPVNPAQRAGEQQEIATAVRNIQILSQAFPEEFKAFVDGNATIKAFLDKTRDRMLQLRPADQVNAAVAQIAQLVKGHLGNVQPQPTTAVQ
jgi:hypothetical protein